MEEIFIALATGGTGNVAQAVNIAIQGFSQTIRGTSRFVKKGAIEIPLHHGSFLLMAATTNSFWEDPYRKPPDKYCQESI